MLEEHPAPARATVPSGKDVTAHCHAQNRTICVRHEVHCYIARVAGMDWRRCLWT
jgi:hypothetical protein